MSSQATIAILHPPGGVVARITAGAGPPRVLDSEPSLRPQLEALLQRLAGRSLPRFGSATERGFAGDVHLRTARQTSPGDPGWPQALARWLERQPELAEMLVAPPPITPGRGAT